MCQKVAINMILPANKSPNIENIIKSKSIKYLTYPSSSYMYFIEYRCMTRDTSETKKATTTPKGVVYRTNSVLWKIERLKFSKYKKDIRDIKAKKDVNSDKKIDILYIFTPTFL